MEAFVAELVGEMERMPVIDSHEHLPPEEELIAGEADVFTRIYCHYSVTNAVAAGFAGDRYTLKDTSIPLEERWQSFRPYVDAIRDTGYARAAQITARDLYGIAEINDETYQELSRRLQETNAPGLYDWVLRRKCGIERVLNQGSWADDYARQVHRGVMGLHEPSPLRAAYAESAKADASCSDPREWVDGYLGRVRASGAVGLKFTASMPTDPVDDALAGALFRKLCDGRLADDEVASLGTWIMHKAIELAPRHGLAVAVHCGLIWNGSGDFRMLNPLNLIPIVLRYPDTIFDLYHAGIPWVREIGVMANQYPNVCLDLVWAHQISPYMTENVLNEWLDLVPANKIIAFGGDNPHGPEKTYGALKMARENIARALAVRARRGEMTETRAAEICRAWLYDNPKRIYGL